jgi:hypothetical protein
VSGAISNTVQTYDRKGLRENLTNAISRISPEETPLISSIGKGKADATLHEWQTDTLAAAVTTNAQIEGDDVSTFPSTSATVRLGNYTQILRKLLILSDTVEFVNKAGRDSEEAYQMAKRGVELRKDLETSVFFPLGGVAGNSSTARQMATLGAYIKTNVDKEAGGGNPTYTSGVPTNIALGRTDGTPRAFSKTILDAVLQACWTSGASVQGMTVYVGPVNKVRASAFTGIATNTYNIDDKPKKGAIIGAADVYVSNFGTVTFMPSRWQRELDAWFIDDSMLEIDYLRPVKRVVLAKSGDAEKRMLIMECTLKVKNEAGLGLAADLTTT